MSDLFATVHMPGEEGLDTFRVTIGQDGPKTPSPICVVFMLTRIAEDLIKQCCIGDASSPREILLKIIASEADIQSHYDTGFIRPNNELELEFDD